MKKFLATVLMAGLLSGCVERVVYTRPAPPPLREEVVVAAPYPDAVWIQGSWNWHPRHRRYDWVPGHWRRR